MPKGTILPELTLIHELARRIFPGQPWHTVEPVDEGGSTHVYRIRRASDVFYLRILPEGDASFAPEAYAHTVLRACGVKVPEIVYFEHDNPALHRSVMVTTEIHGTHAGQLPLDDDTREIFRAAGRDLALINGVAVDGFGWIKRDSAVVGWLEAELPAFRAFVHQHREAYLSLVSEELLSARQVRALRALLPAFDGQLDDGHAWLAHGDFDVSHIYHAQGRYSGIIDFGEIRGAYRLYDLGHFWLHDEQQSYPALPDLLEGYRSVVELPSDSEELISYSSLLIGIRAFANVSQRPWSAYHDHLVRAIRRDATSLVGGSPER